MSNAVQDFEARTRDLIRSIRNRLSAVACEYPRNPCHSAKDIETECDTCLAVTGARLSLDALERHLDGGTLSHVLMLDATYGAP